MHKFVSVIIPVLNNIEGLSKTLAALDNQTYPSELYEVIVVDNGSDENLAGLIFRFQQAKITYEKQPGSYAARNLGIAVAKGEILAFTDSDCIPAPDWLANGIEHLLSVPDCGLVAGKINFFFKNHQNPTAIELYDSITFLNQKKYIKHHQYGATANLFTFKTVVHHVGIFNSNLKSGGDKEWGKRVFQHGYSLLYADDSCVAHPAITSLQKMYQKILRTMEGGYDIDQLYTNNKSKFYLSKLMIIIWRLKPPVISIFFKIKYCYFLINTDKKIKLVYIIFLLHYYKVWLEIKFYLTRDNKYLEDRY